MNSFGILDLALPFAAIAIFLGWMGIRGLIGRGTPAREAPAADRARDRSAAAEKGPPGDGP